MRKAQSLWNGFCAFCNGDKPKSGLARDLGLIYRLIFNLTENAIRYNRPDGTVRVSVSQEGDDLVVRVADTGCGIPEKYKESIFQPFFRVDKSRSRENGGVGLGLSLVWEIADIHGGKVQAEESTEKGTVMTVTFPLNKEYKDD